MTVNLFAFGIYNGYAPIDGPKGMPVTYVIPAGANVAYSMNDDLAQAAMDNAIAFIQSLWIDNSENDFDFTMTFAGTGQRLKCPARSQGVFPVFVINPPQFNISTTSVAAAFNVPLIFLNVPMPHAIWSV